MKEPSSFILGFDTFTTYHHNKNVMVTGMIGKAKPVTPELQSAMFRCEMCGKLINVPQGGGKCSLLRPECCTNKNCKSTKPSFTFMQERSKFSNYQEVWLKPMDEPRLRLGQGQKIILKKDLVGVKEGESVLVKGKLGFELIGKTNLAIPIVLASEIQQLDKD